ISALSSSSEDNSIAVSSSIRNPGTIVKPKSTRETSPNNASALSTAKPARRSGLLRNALFKSSDADDTFPNSMVITINYSIDYNSNTSGATSTFTSTNPPRQENRKSEEPWMTRSNEPLSPETVAG